jgi:hypothetical protein
MPCRWSRRCRAAAPAAATNDALPSPTSAPDVEDWKTIRKYHLRRMRKQIRSVVLLMALMEAVRVGPLKLVYAGREGFPAPGEDDFGVRLQLEKTERNRDADDDMYTDCVHCRIHPELALRLRVHGSLPATAHRKYSVHLSRT